MTDTSHPQNVAQADSRQGTLLGEHGRRYLTITELSDVTGISISTLQRLRRKGALPFYQPGGPRTRIVFPADAIEQAMKAKQDAASLPHDATVAAPKTPTRGPRPKW